jgi:hypothetical protein
LILLQCVYELDVSYQKTMMLLLSVGYLSKKIDPEVRSHMNCQIFDKLL